MLSNLRSLEKELPHQYVIKQSITVKALILTKSIPKIILI
ncbi:hypothetical protein HMPREF9104_00218 [Lentilactobacillus kisonensis F0435]|uniref:Uncharacterized protein n=1 Tax=Lentilactobacillus kisonensis F0435 TaxID=797516 RepID=H1LCA5_9LACO|nr:hypothetical protein HMPREF9104_00218 [Lentilactobacillus kisonensis F0435]